MPGANLNLDLPTASDNMKTVRDKLVTALQAVEADLAPRIPAGALNITTNLSMGGAALLNVGGVRLSGGQSDEIGTLYMDEELHAVTPAGNVQITANGGLNIAALGTIGGDYGGANPAAVIFDDASGEYRFYEDESPVDWAVLVANQLRLEGANGSIRLFVDDAIATARSLGIKTLPSSGVSGLVYNATNATIEDGAATRETNTHLFTSVDLTGSLVVSQRSYLIGPGDMYPQTTGGPIATMGSAFAWDHAVSGASSIYVPIRLPPGSVIVGLKWYGYKNSATGTISAGFRRSAVDGSGDYLLASVGSNSAAAPGNINFENAAINHTVLTGSVYYVRIFTSGQAGDGTFALQVTYSGPAV